MPRPIKWRKVGFIPEIRHFVPSDVGQSEVDENILHIEELEAIRLKDLEGLEQEDCAVKMEVSRPTFQRILNSGRQKVADALINGKAIRIEGGIYTQNICQVRCDDCGKEWKESFENYEKMQEGTYQCPKCNSKKVLCFNNKDRRLCKGNCWRRGRMQE